MGLVRFIGFIDDQVAKKSSAIKISDLEADRTTSLSCPGPPHPVLFSTMYTARFMNIK